MLTIQMRKVLARLAREPKGNGAILGRRSIFLHSSLEGLQRGGEVAFEVLPVLLRCHVAAGPRPARIGWFSAPPSADRGRFCLYMVEPRGIEPLTS